MCDCRAVPNGSRGKITGSAFALHCCKAHTQINRKRGNSTSCKIVTPENFILKLCTRDYVGDVTRHANFGFKRYSGGFSQTGEKQCVSKNIPDIFSCNFRKHSRIFIMFGTRVTEKVTNQQLL